MSDRPHRLKTTIRGLLLHSSNFVLERTIFTYVSQEAWEKISTRIADVFDSCYDRSFDVKKILAETDVQDESGKLNAAEIIRCVEAMAKRPKLKEEHRHRLEHLANHLRVTFEDLRLVPTGEDHGRQETPPA